MTISDFVMIILLGFISGELVMLNYKLWVLCQKFECEDEE